MKRDDCVIQLRFESGNTKGMVIGAREPLLFAEAEEPILAVEQICDYVRGRRLDVTSVSIRVERKGMARAVANVLSHIAKALRGA